MSLLGNPWSKTNPSHPVVSANIGARLVKSCVLAMYGQFSKTRTGHSWACGFSVGRVAVRKVFRKPPHLHTVSSDDFNSQHFKSRVSTPKTLLIFAAKHPLEVNIMNMNIVIISSMISY